MSGQKIIRGATETGGKGALVKTLWIEWLTDYWDCETCGGNYAEGARVTLGDAVVLDLKPQAHCYEGANWDREDVWRMLLERFSPYRVSIVGEPEPADQPK